jgi:hypothetical protein
MRDRATSQWHGHPTYSTRTTSYITPGPISSLSSSKSTMANGLSAEWQMCPGRLLPHQPNRMRSQLQLPPSLSNSTTPTLRLCYLTMFITLPGRRSQSGKIFPTSTSSSAELQNSLTWCLHAPKAHIFKSPPKIFQSLVPIQWSEVKLNHNTEKTSGFRSAKLDPDQAL